VSCSKQGNNKKNRKEVTLERLEEIIAFNNPSYWPQWPFLPVKKGSFNELDHEIGVIVAGRGAVVFLVNLFLATTESLRLCEKVVFDNFEALYDAGWRGD